MLVALLLVIIVIMIVSLVAFTIYHFIKRTDKIGLNYKKGVSQEFDSIAENIQKIVNMMENTKCKEIKTMLASEMYKTMLNETSSISCNDMRSELKNLETLEPGTASLITSIFASVCTGEKLDKTKIEKLVNGVYDSMCSQEW